MDIVITARGLQVTDRFREYATEKAEKIESLATRAIALQITVVRQSSARTATSDDRVELTLVGPGPLVRAEASAADKFAAFDLAYGKLLERIRASKDRRKIHRGRHRPASLSEIAADGFSAVDVTPASAEVLRAVATGSIPVIAEEEQDADESPVVIRQKVFPAETLSREEAVDRMELVGHDFFLFVDAANDRPSVVYRRKGWAYGVIGLDAETIPTETAEARRKRA